MTHAIGSWARVFARLDTLHAIEDAEERASRARLERLIGRLRETNDQGLKAANDTAAVLRARFQGE